MTRSVTDQGRKLLRLASTRFERTPRVLLEAEDDELRAFLAETLRCDSYDVTVCCNGSDLVDHLLAISEPSDFDLIIATIYDRAFNALQVLKGGDFLCNFPPLILLTGTANENSRKLSERLGASLFDQSVELDDLMTRVHELAPPTRVVEERP
jgi:DNA-binding response OmpR family regulator